MGKSVIEINTAVRKYSTELAGVAAKIKVYTSQIEGLEVSFLARAEKLKKEAEALTASAEKAKADLKTKYEAEAKEIEGKTKAQLEQLAKQYMTVGKGLMAQLSMPAMMAAIATGATECKGTSEDCNEMLKELPKAPGDEKLRKGLEVLTAKTAKDYKSLETQYSALHKTGQKAMDSCGATSASWESLVRR